MSRLTVLIFILVKKDYLQAHQEKLVLERDLSKIKEGIPEAMQDKSQLTMALRAKILGMEKEMADLKVRLVEVGVKLEQAESDLKLSQADREWFPLSC